MKKLYGDHYKSYQVIDGWNKGNITDEMLKWCENLVIQLVLFIKTI